MANEIKRDTVDYRDSTPFDNTKLNSLSEISKALRHKTYGEDTREAIAQQGEALVKLMQETGGNQSAEVVAARGPFEQLGVRETAQDNALKGLDANKADKNYVNNYLSKISNVPETVKDKAELNSKYPTGNPGLFVTADTGHKFIWLDGEGWHDSGIYQSVGLADGSVVPSKVSSVNGWQTALNEITGINPVPWNDSSKKIAIDYDAKNGTFSATTPATDYPDSGMLFQAVRQSGDYTLRLSSINSNLSKFPIYIADKNGGLKVKLGVFFTGGASDGDEVIEIASSSFDTNGLKVGEQFQILASIGKDEVGGKRVSGEIQLLRREDAILTTRPINLQNHLASVSDDLADNHAFTDYRRKYAVDTQWTRWFSNQKYSIAKDGTITYWWDGEGNPGPYYSWNSPVATGQTIYAYFEAKKNAGENASIDIQPLNEHIFDNPVQDFRIGDPITVKLSNDWESYFVPIELTQNYAQNDLSTAGAVLSIRPGTVGERIEIQLKNTAFIYGGGVDIQIMDESGISQGVVDELQFGLRKGELIPSGAAQSTLPKVHYVSPKNSVIKDNLFLDSITVNVVKAGKVNFAVGSVDQNNLMIKSREFSLNLPAGLRTIEFKEDIAIPAGNRLFMDCNGQGVLYKSDKSTEKILIEDEDHFISNGAYSGYELYESDLMAPFSYKVRSRKTQQKIENIAEKTDDNTDQINKVKKSVNVLTSPSGKKYRLVVNDDGSLTTASFQPKKGCFFGNSLTVGLDGYGMAASNEAHSWASLVGKRLKELEPSFTFKRLNGGNAWESKETSKERLDSLNDTVKPELDSDTDLVIIQLTDNVNTPEKRASFPQDAKDLITWFKQQVPKARIVWAATWFAGDLIGYVKKACEERGATFVDITSYARESKYKSALGLKWTDSKGVEHVIDNLGVAAHPGDLGMEMIAKSVLEALDV